MPNHLRTIALAMAVVCVGGADPAAERERPVRQAVLQLKWYHQFQFAGYYAAQAKGFYRDEGFDVRIEEGDPGHSVLSRVLAGEADFGVGDADLVVARMAGEPVVVLASVFQHSPYVLLTRRDSGITTPFDLVGRTVMLQGDRTEAQLRAVFLCEGIPLERLRIVPHSWSLDDLVDRRVDAMSAYSTVEVHLLRARGVEPGVIRARDYGVDFYAEALFTRADVVARDREGVEAFRRASLRGWEYAMQHVGEMADLIAGFDSVRRRRVTREQLLLEAESMRELILPDVVEIGHINPARWERMAQTYLDLGVHRGPVSLAGFVLQPEVAGTRAWRGRLAWTAGIGLPILGLSVLWIVQLRRSVATRTTQLQEEVEHRRETEDRLRASEERTRTVIQNMPVMLDAFDDQGHIAFWNRECERVTGYSAAEMVGNPHAMEWLYPDPTYRDRVEQDIKACGQEAEWELRARDGSTRLVAWSGLAARVPIPGWAVWGIGLDVTERRRAELERARLEDQLLQAQKLESLGVLAGGIAHDFNNLLTGVLGHADLALLDLPDESPARTAVSQIELSARRAADLTRQLLAYSGKGRFVVEAVDLTRLIAEMRDLLELSVSRRARLEFRFADRLPAVEADATQLRQVVMNLIINAAEAIGENGGRIFVATGHGVFTRGELATSILDEGLPDGEYVFVEVADTGHGMVPDVMDRIFDPFFTTKFTGRGLGLAAVLGIVRGHRGAIRVSSEVGTGSTLTVLLPASQRPAGVTAPPQPRRCADWRADGAVLVVDDEPGVRETAAAMLRRMGFDPLLAAGGSEALDLAAAHGSRLRAVLLDLTMPGMSGEETLAALRRVRPDLRIVLSSGYTEQEASRRVAAVGVDGFVQKPYKYDALVERMRAVCGQPT